MSSSSQSAERRSYLRYFGWLGGAKGVMLYLLLSLSLVSAIVGFDPGKALSFFLFPLVIGLSVVAGLLFRYTGALICFGLVLCLGLTLERLDAGLFQGMAAGQGFIFVFGQALTNGLFAMLSALAFGYNFHRSELATDRQNLLHKVFNALPIGIWVRARDGSTVFVNDRWADFSEQSVDDIVDSGETRAPVDLGEDWERRVEAIIDSDNSAVHYENIELKNSEGTSSSMTLLTLRMFIDQKNDYGSLSLLIDETALRAYEAKIRQSEENLQLALHNAKMGFWTNDSKTREIQCDANWYGLIGATAAPGEKPAKFWEERLHPEDRDRVRQIYRGFYQSGADTARLDYRLRNGDGGYIWVQDSIVVTARSEDGKIASVMGTTQDISEQKEAELELTLAKEKAETANQVKGQFIATISHEIRTPLNAIIGLSSFLTEGDLDEDCKDLAQTIHTSGMSLLSLVNEILDFSKIEAGRLRLESQEFPLQLCLEESIKLFKFRAAQKNIGLTLQTSEGLPEFALGDMERLKQILQNLLSNALKFTEQGEVTVTVRALTANELEPEHRSDFPQQAPQLGDSNKEFLEVRVRDTGIGIPKERQYLLFQAFSQLDASTTRKYEGTGLGLVICKRLVDAMGGRIWVESEAEKGAEFSFLVPIKFISEELVSAGSGKSTGSVRKLAAQYPLDVLVVGPEAHAASCLQACRSLGYAPHHAVDYELGEGGFGYRQYDLLLVALDAERKALELARRVSTATYTMRPEAIVGFGEAGKDLSQKRCRLSGLAQVIEGAPKAETLRTVITEVVGARG